MARITSLPSPEIIKGFKGIIDFVEWRGIFYVRKWPVTPRSSLSEAHFERAALFGAIVQAYSLLGSAILAAYQVDAQNQPRTARDLHVAAVLGKYHEVSMSDFLDLLQRAVDALEKIDDLQGALASFHTDLLRVEAEDGDKLLSFESIVEVDASDLDLDAGTNVLNGVPVPAGKVWKITHAMILYGGTPPDRMFLQVSGLAGDIHLLDVHTVVSGQDYFWSGEVFLQVGDCMQLYILGASAGDEGYLRYAGIQTNAP